MRPQGICIGDCDLLRKRTDEKILSGMRTDMQPVSELLHISFLYIMIKH